VEAISSIIETLEALRDAVWAEDPDEAFAAATCFAFQMGKTFGHDPRIWRATYPLLEKLKTSIESRDFEEANVVTLAFLAKFRRVARLEENTHHRTPK
jgi:hypothetical protein